MADLKDLVKTFGDDFECLSNVDPIYLDYVLAHQDRIQTFIRNHKYQCKYMLGMNEEETKKSVKQALSDSLNKSELAKKFIASQK